MTGYRGPKHTAVAAIFAAASDTAVKPAGAPA